ncbi:MAG: heparin lyase I family protein [Myxococcales bacterium]|nr:heparin lyase I family protein [Myxococcales bacterium]
MSPRLLLVASLVVAAGACTLDVPDPNSVADPDLSAVADAGARELLRDRGARDADLPSGEARVDAGDVGPDAPIKRLFEDGFESGDVSAFKGNNVGTGDSLSVVANPAFAGSYALRCSVDSAATGQAMVWHDLPPANRYYLRLRVYLDSAFATTSRVNILQTLYGGWNNIIGFTIRPDLTFYLWNSAASEEYNSGGVTLKRATWHSIEVLVGVSSSAGEVAVWLDGQQIVDATGVNTGSNPIERFVTGIFWLDPETEPNTITIDDVAVDTAPFH